MEKLRQTIIKINQVLAEAESSEEVDGQVRGLLADYFRDSNTVNNFLEKSALLFSDAVEEYIYFLSLCFQAKQEKLFLDTIQKWVFREALPWDYVSAICQQINSNRFRYSGIDITYREKRENQKILTEKFRQVLNKDLEFIPYEKRNRKRILLTTDTLLSVKSHAPTQVVCQTAHALQYILGYEILIGVHVVKTPSNISESWYHPVEAGYLPDLNYASKYSYRGQDFSVYQQIVDERHIRGVRRYIDMVREYNPSFIWHIGSESVLTEILAELTTVAMMPCTQGYAASEAQILMAYLLSDKRKISKMEEYIRQHNQKTLQVDVVLSREQEEKTFTSADFGFTEQDFIIVIVGNRLNSEIDGEFISVMQKVADMKENIRFVIVGQCSIEWTEYGLGDKVCNYGYCNELLGLLKVVHLFLNPRRQGGAGGAADAIYVGTPICTLPACDVADNGEAFVCSDYDAMVEMVRRYYEDEEFYAAQVRECHRIKEIWDNNSIPLSSEKAVSQVREWLEKEEVN